MTVAIPAERTKRRILELLFASDEPMTLGRLCDGDSLACFEVFTALWYMKNQEWVEELFDGRIRYRLTPWGFYGCQFGQLIMNAGAVDDDPGDISTHLLKASGLSTPQSPGTQCETAPVTLASTGAANFAERASEGTAQPPVGQPSPIGKNGASARSAAPAGASPNCPNCVNGGVWVGGQERYIPCNACGGTGEIRGDDNERTAAVGRGVVPCRANSCGDVQRPGWDVTCPVCHHTHVGGHQCGAYGDSGSSGCGCTYQGHLPKVASAVDKLFQKLAADGPIRTLVQCEVCLEPVERLFTCEVCAVSPRMCTRCADQHDEAGHWGDSDTAREMFSDRGMR